MNKGIMVFRIASACFLLTITGMAAHAQRSVTTISITCKSSLNTCYSYDQSGTIVNVAGDVVDVVVDRGHGRACSAEEIPLRNIFLHSPGDQLQGKGYVGADICIDPGQRSGIVMVPEESTVYSSFTAWKEAVELAAPF